MDILHVAPTLHLCSMAKLLRDSAEEIHGAIERLEQDSHIAGKHAVHIKAIENRMENALC